MVDLSGIQRVFNNAFSNIMKYAERKHPVMIEAKVEEDQIIIMLSNTISEHAKKVESNKIGLKTCEKICSMFNGKFVYAEREHTFITWIHLPVVKKDIEVLEEKDLEMMKEQS